MHFPCSTLPLFLIDLTRNMQAPSFPEITSKISQGCYMMRPFPNKILVPQQISKKMKELYYRKQSIVKC